MEKTFSYNVIVTQHSIATNVEVQQNCNGVSIRNIGNTTAVINGVQILPAPAPGLSGESYSFGGNLGEIYTGRLQLRFLLPIGTNPNVEIIQKFYVYDER